MMRSVGIKVLKNKLSEYVRLAASGETVLVTDRDRVVADLCRRESESTRRSKKPGGLKQVRLGHITPATDRGPHCRRGLTPS